ncbi:2-keto-4-pentenoate hydratase [Ramlibacter rhizophilus]|uniref:4-oxalocrotonate decarboxylase n=1 Tax=Ramlibacter rhizophilus TaxID=1781167 RepID=A0A4Z0BGN3_9BURK|nr:fumarylacetoacetate hydrolase family protein [Ramlibacter rhizophilus]TFY97427.1 4-oxalocrotonate decarboxylase [Ramlibacter rhizophilus]
MSNITEFARLLDEAARTATEVDQIDPKSEMSLEDAYRVQQASIARRLERGEKRVGVKMGFTSRAKMVQMGLSDVIWGRLTDGMRVEEGGKTSFSRYVHPRAEPEIAFVLKKPLDGAVTAVEALAAVEAVAPAIEIIDSRYKDFKFTLPDVIADNASSSGFVIGPWCDPHQDFANLGLTLSIDGRVVQVGSTAAILAHPLRSLVAAARLSAAAGEPLQAGWVVMAGGATAAEWIKPGQYVSLEMEGLGGCGFHMGE